MKTLTTIAAPLAGGCCALLLSGCANFSPDGGFTAVKEEVKNAIGHDAHWLRDEQSKALATQQVRTLLGQTLTAATAEQIALLNNPVLQAELAELQMQEAALVEAGRIPNPGFSFAKTTGNGGQEVERGLHFNLLAFLTIPIRYGIEEERFESVKLSAARSAIEFATDARMAYFEAVAARQSVDYARQVLEAAGASRELMARMSAVGNSSRLQHAREQLFHAQALAALGAAAEQKAAGAQEALVRALGLWGGQADIKLPEQLPDLPEAPREIKNLEQQAVDQRLDLRQAKHALKSLAANLQMTRSIGFLNVLELGPAQVRERGDAIRDGYEVSLEVPIFDFGEIKSNKAQAQYSQALNRLRGAAIAARSEVRGAYVSYRTAYDLARHYRDEIVPLRKRISDEQLLRYNGMLTGVFDLIADAREQIISVNAYLETLRQFWLADTALRSAMLTGKAPPVNLAAAASASPANGGGH